MYLHRTPYRWLFTILICEKIVLASPVFAQHLDFTGIKLDITDLEHSENGSGEKETVMRFLVRVSTEVLS